MYRLLVIDNEAEIAEMLSGSQGTEGFEVFCMGYEKTALDQILTSAHSQYDLILLNIDLPIVGGVRQLRAIRSRQGTPLIIYTESSRKTDGIRALENGADHFMLKPLEPRELHARIRNVLRRSGRSGPEQLPVPEMVLGGDITVDVGARIARRNGIELRLTSAEFGLLHALVGAAGQILSREHLAKIALGRPLGSKDRSIDMLMSRLRKKLGKKDGDELIKTVRGEGFVYTAGAG